MEDKLLFLLIKKYLNFTLAVLFMLLSAHVAMANVVLNGSVSINHDDNIPNAELSTDIFSDTYLDLSFRPGKLFTPGVGKTILLSGIIEPRRYEQTDGLNRLNLGFAALYEQRLGMGAYAPRINFGFSAANSNYDSEIRDSWLLSTSFGLEKRFTPALKAAGSLSYEQRDPTDDGAMPYGMASSSNVFDQKNWALDGELEYTFENYSVLTLRYRYRDGETVSIARPNPSLFIFSTAITMDTDIGDGYVAYLLDSSSHTFGLDWSYPLGDDLSATFAYERRQAEADGNNEYESNVLRFELNMRF
ncbi:hypothetical protein OAP18_02290 [Gammaproteobacteria bacterium]|nr:hypothetical protein [Gammaproteobacteria bacterium]